MRADAQDVLVTGGSGFLGRAVLRRLPGATAPNRETLDLRQAEAVQEYLVRIRPRVVVHLAARVGGITANVERPAEFLVDNLRIDAGLLAAVGEFRPEHLIVMLSTCMYPDRLPDDRYPMTEDMFEDGPPAPTNAGYALAKRALHLGARAVGSQFGVPWTALVPANLYGPGDHFGSRDSHFLAAAVRRIEEARRAGRPEVTFFGTGRALRQYVFADDVARLVARLVSGGPRHAAFNVAPEGARSIRNLAGLVARVAGYAGQIRFSAEGPDGQYRKDVTSARLRAACPAWAEIETPLEEGVRQTVEWYRAHVATR